MGYDVYMFDRGSMYVRGRVYHVYMFDGGSIYVCMFDGGTM